MLKKAFKIFLNIIPVLFMIGLIPLVESDFILTSLYVAVIIVSLLLVRNHGELLFFCLGFVCMIVSEYVFISTGVETFVRNSLFGIMPLWLPFLWGYGFIVIRRSVHILDH